MKRRVFLCLALAALAGGGVFAQTHFVSAEVTFLGGGARYEYVINPYVTVGGYIYYAYMPMFFLSEGADTIDTSNFSAGIAGRWYPTGRKFFTEFDIGYSSYSVTQRQQEGYRYKNMASGKWGETRQTTGEVSFTSPSFSVALGIGWTIDIGKPGGLFINPGIKFPWCFTSLEGIDIGIGKGVLPFGILSFGLGYAF